MTLFLSSSDALEMLLGMETLAQVGIRYEFRYEPATQTKAQLWVQEDTDLPRTHSLLQSLRAAK